MSDLDRDIATGHLGASLITVQAFTWRCILCNVESIEVVGDKDYVLTMIRIHNQRAKHPLAYGNRAIDRKCHVCNAEPNSPCQQGKYPLNSGFHIERWGDLGAPSSTS